MATGLRQQTLARIHQHDRQFGVGRTGGHVARVLLVPRTIGDDEVASRGVEVAVGHVDGDALFALGVQAIGEQREIQRIAGAGVQASAVAHQRGNLVVGKHAGVVQQAPEQRALAVVHAAAGDEAQQVAAIGGGGGIDGGHQKYPSCFLRSIDALASWSITRPWRSEVRDAAISSMILSSVSACDSTAPVSG